MIGPDATIPGMAVASPERLGDELVRLLHRGAAVPEFTRDAARILARAVPFDGVCMLTMDPATLLPTGEVVENGLPPEATARMTEIEMRGDDFNAFRTLARSARPAAALSAATGGDLDRSRRHREVRRPHGFGDELRAALVDDDVAWGGLTLLRADDREAFTPAEATLVACVAWHLAEGVRRAILAGALSAERRPRVDRGAPDAHLEVQVRPGRVAGRADRADPARRPRRTPAAGRRCGTGARTTS